MASKSTIEIVKSTAPILKEYGEEITTVFYKRLFENNPELKNIFNMTHQKQGTQPKVLANAIFMYAQYIDNLEALSGVVEGIAQKHSSLGIKPEMYNIVGENLLAAIKEVLGDGATDEVINAWAEAYGDLANVFINREEQIYVQKELSKGGFRGKRTFKVIDKVKESDLITSFYVKPSNGEQVPDFIPGQYVALSVGVPGESHEHTRNYSLSDAPNKDYLRISVKKEEGSPNGIVSNYLHNNVQEGDELEFGIPAGEFVLQDSDRQVVLISGGVGVTPLMSMYNSLKTNEERKVVFIQCAKNGYVHAFKDEVKEEQKNGKFVVVYDEPMSNDEQGKDYHYKGYLTKEILTKEIENIIEAEIYFCGPTPFMRNTLQILKEIGVSESQIHYEFFGPSEELQA